MKFWLRSYFIRSSQHSDVRGAFNESWSVRTAPFWTSPADVTRGYIAEKEKELGGTSFIEEFRRI